MSLRLLQKHVGAKPAEASVEARAALQPKSRGRGKGGASLGPPPADIAKRVEDFIRRNEVDDQSANMLRQAAPTIQHAALELGDLLGARDPSQVLRGRIRGASGESSKAGSASGYCGGGAEGKGGGAAASSRHPTVMAPAVGAFHGSYAQAAHVAATQKATAADARSKQEWTSASEVAVRSGLGLRALEERKEREDAERQAKREAARAKRLGEVTKREAEEAQGIADCEEQAWCDSEANERLKYEAALVVRIAVHFGVSGVWMKIAEARARGAEIPLDSKKIYLLAHPDRCPMPEATDATAILNAQRPPEMSESHSSAGAAAGVGSKEAVAARVAAARSLKKIDPEDEQMVTFQELLQKHGGEFSEVELKAYWEEDCKALPEISGATTGASEIVARPVDAEEDARKARIAARAAKAAAAEPCGGPREETKTLEKTCLPGATTGGGGGGEGGGGHGGGGDRGVGRERGAVSSAASAGPAGRARPNDLVRKTDPEDGQICTFSDLLSKYTGAFSDEELQAYWYVDCTPLPAGPCGSVGSPGRGHQVSEVEACSSTTGVRDTRTCDMASNAGGATSKEDLPRAGATVTIARTTRGDEMRKSDPEDGQVCTLSDLRRKYDGMYSEEELLAYWRDDCKDPLAEPATGYTIQSSKDQPQAPAAGFSMKSRRF